MSAMALLEQVIGMGTVLDPGGTASFEAAADAARRGDLDDFKLRLRSLGDKFILHAHLREGGGASGVEEGSVGMEAASGGDTIEEDAIVEEEAPILTTRQILFQWNLLFKTLQDSRNHPAARLFISDAPEAVLVAANCLGKLLQEFPDWKEEVEVLVKSRSSAELLTNAFTSGRRWLKSDFGVEALELLLDHCTNETFRHVNRMGDSIVTIVLGMCWDAREEVILAVITAAPAETLRSEKASSTIFGSPLLNATLKGTDAVFEIVASACKREDILGSEKHGNAFYSAIHASVPLERIKRLFEIADKDCGLFRPGQYATGLVNFDPLTMILKHESPATLEWVLDLVDAPLLEEMTKDTNILHAAILKSPQASESFEVAFRAVQKRWPDDLQRMLTEECTYPPAISRNPYPFTVLSAVALKGSAELLETLLDVMSILCPEAIVSTCKKSRATALHWAVQGRCPAKLALLLPLFDHSARAVKSRLFKDCTAEELAEGYFDDTMEDILALFKPQPKAAV